MAFDSEEKKSDFESWAEAMTYEEEKELKRQEKLQQKQERLAEKAAKKAAKNNTAEASDKTGETEGGEAKAEDSKSDETKTETESVNKEASEGDGEKTEEAENSEETSDKTDADEEYNPDYIKVKKKKDPNEVNIVKELLSLIIYIGIVIILCYLIITYVGQRTTVNGRSMENTLHDGDNLWIDKFTYHFKDPERFDIIVFPYEDDVYYIKRVIGLPGETVQILPDGTILINGKRLVESYGKEIILESGTAAEERTLGEDEFFVLGDNRNDSRDSRWADVGDINKEDIIGKAVLRLSPIKQFGKLDK